MDFWTSAYVELQIFMVWSISEDLIVLVLVKFSFRHLIDVKIESKSFRNSSIFCEDLRKAVREAGES